MLVSGRPSAAFESRLDLVWSITVSDTAARVHPAVPPDTHPRAAGNGGRNC
jgi:hypothetical protein